MPLHILYALSYASRFLVCRCHVAVHSNAEIQISEQNRRDFLMRS
jgi:hypothetical protein